MLSACKRRRAPAGRAAGAPAGSRGAAPKTSVFASNAAPALSFDLAHSPPRQARGPAVVVAFGDDGPPPSSGLSRVAAREGAREAAVGSSAAAQSQVE